ncbi:hypothetical protein FO519_001470 [Halicephalobus sp. NKZ332]|nr:hypothetical protein FO519_001470 [Halicephalobus sp. NKZ332]
MDVRRQDLSGLREREGKVEVEFMESTWFIHPGGCKVLTRFPDMDSVQIVVDDHWNSKDVIVLDEVIGMFRNSVEEIVLDAPIVELIIASLSMIDLDRWYAFLCFMKATNNNEMHLSLDRVAHSPFEENELYFPEGRQLVIRTTERDSAHLARILDYGVRSQLVVNRQKLDVIKVIVTDVPQLTRSKKELNRNILRFRCWAGSAGFDDRYQQSYVNCP